MFILIMPLRSPETREIQQNYFCSQGFMILIPHSSKSDSSDRS
ncbi:MAG: hypothetical protein QNJ70_19515 [Xenococcaceae cyanobacterium MO_207.B15]|nr:hypothetical protein [Xenococcaceae cyanobacterium MO_207.B15]